MDNIDFSISPKKLYEHVVEALENVLVLSAPDKKLPSEQELAARFNVSKAVIREALTVLKERGLVQSRNGDGSYVAKPNAETVVNAVGRMIQTNSISDQNLHQTRLVLEIATVRLAASQITANELDQLGSTITRMSDLSIPFDEWMAVDMEFHIAMAAASRNELLRMFVEVMMTLLRRYMTKALLSTFDQPSTLDEHRRIISALRSGDEAECEESVRSHLMAAWRNVNAYEKHRGRN